MRGDLRKGIELSEVFGHSLGAAGILLTVFVVAIDRRKVVWWAVCLTALSGLTANLMKGTVARIRPHSIELLGEDALNPNASQASEPRSFWDSRQRSFPSGHAATAWGLAVGLSFIFPRGTLLFAAFATLASLQRIYSGAHFPSDVLAGAAIAFAWAWLLLSTPISYLLCRSDNSTIDSDQPSHRSGHQELT